MPLKGVKCVLGYVPMEQHRQCMVTQPGPPCGVEPSILELMTRPSFERAESGVVFSPSSLSTCHRQTVLSGKNDWYMDVRSGYKRIRGTIIHEGMGHEPPYPGVLGVVRELRMSAPIQTKHGEQVFHGKPDLVVLNHVEEIPFRWDSEPIPERPGYVQVTETYPARNVLHVKIVDYKSKDEIRHDLLAAERKHVYQVNMYAWLVQRFLPGWLNAAETGIPPLDGTGQFDFKLHLFLGQGVRGIPHVDDVVVDELSIVYLDMKRTRSFTSRGFLYDQGKMLSDYKNGRWVRRKPAEYEELELEPIHQFSQAYVESLIRKGIEDQIDAESVLAPPLTGEDARIMCTNCPVRQVCYDIGRQEGYGMEDQAPYATQTTATD